MQSETTTRSVFGSHPVARSAVDIAGRVVAQRNMEPALTARLDSAGLLLKPGEWTLLHLGAGLLGALLLLLLSGGAIIATAPRPCSRPHWAVRLPFHCGLSSTGCVPRPAAGDASAHGGQPVSRVTRCPRPSTPSSVRAASRSAGNSIGHLVQTRLGVPVEDALESVAVRLRSTDLDVGGDGDPHSARGRGKPLRGSRQRCGHPARARTATSSGTRAFRRRQAIRLDSCAPAGGIHALSRPSATGILAPAIHHNDGLAFRRLWLSCSSWLACSGYDASSRSRCDVLLVLGLVAVFLGLLVALVASRSIVEQRRQA